MTCRTLGIFYSVLRSFTGIGRHLKKDTPTVLQTTSSHMLWEMSKELCLQYKMTSFSPTVIWCINTSDRGAKDFFPFFLHFNGPQVRYFERSQAVPNDTLGAVEALGNFSLSLFLHFSPLNFFHYVFVKKASQERGKKSRAFFLAPSFSLRIELTPWHERYVSKGRKRRVNFWL